MSKINEESGQSQDMPPKTLQGGDHTIEHDAVDWPGTVVLMMKTKFGLGVLSIPDVLNTLGLIPGVICICAISAITTWPNYMIGCFKLKHCDIYGIDDAGGLMFGPIGHEFFAVGICIYWIFCAGSGMVSCSIGLNVISAHGICTAVFVAVAAIVSFGLTAQAQTWVHTLCTSLSSDVKQIR